MNKKFIHPITSAWFVIFLVIASGCQKNLKPAPNLPGQGGGTDMSPKELKNFVQVNLVGNNSINKPWNVDAGLVNAWGISFLPNGWAYISSNGNGFGNIYNLDGKSMAPAISISHSASASGGQPTGQVYNFTSDFKLPDGNPATFIFATADGTIAGWNNGGTAVKKIDNSGGASYLGIALAPVGSDFFLYAANFAQNRVEVYDKNWNPANISLTDPELPDDYSPVNIQIIRDASIFVLYAKKNAAGQIEKGPGKGYINVFSPDGVLQKRFASKGKLNAPWGITVAPAGFWGEWNQTANMILVANNGDGQIHAFDENGNYAGPISTRGKAIEIDGLWGITFPPINGFNHYYLYFAAGPDGGKNGLVGYIKTQFIN